MKLFNSDCLIALKQIPAESVDLVVTSPPYDNLRKYEGAGDQWNFDKFKIIADELCRILKRGGGDCLDSRRRGYKWQRNRRQLPTSALFQG